MPVIVAAHDSINHAKEQELVFKRGKVERALS